MRSSDDRSARGYSPRLALVRSRWNPPKVVCVSSTLGWIDFSEHELRAARRLLANEDVGVRDELGLLAVHAGYADRFFPGTSVLQTRLRYALFVPWLYKDCAHDRGSRPLADRVQERELRLARALKAASEQGVIGDRLADSGQAPAQPPTFVYWTLLRTWGILQLPVSRMTFHRQFARVASPRGAFRDEDGGRVEELSSLWHASLPRSPGDDWIASATFSLRSDEREFLRRRIQLIPTGSVEGPRLLQSLVELAPGPDPFWASPAVLDAAGKERAIVERAGHAAGFVAILRALYNAHVEHALKRRGEHLAVLAQRLGEYHRDAEVLDLDALGSDRVVSESLFKFLGRARVHVLSARRAKDLLGDEVVSLVAKQEQRRKGRRARLGNLPAHEKNREAWAREDKAATTKPLDYRWGRVYQLLADLNETAISA